MKIYLALISGRYIQSIEAEERIGDLKNWVFAGEYPDVATALQAMGVTKPLLDNRGPNYAYENGLIRETAVEEKATGLALIEGKTLPAYKSAKIANSKERLATYLEAHPLTYSDGKQYSVTAEKQSLLTSALARHQIATAAGVQTALKWNATGEECTVWEYADLAALALAIAAYVEPLVGQQQAAEVAINACTTIDEVKAIAIAYGS